MNDFIKKLMSTADNQDPEIAHWLALIAVVAGIGLSVYDVVALKHAWNLQQYGIGMGALFAGVGAWLKLKENSNP